MGNLFIYLIVGVFKAIGGIFQIFFSSIKAIFGWTQSSNKKRTSNSNLNALYGMQKQIQVADKTNDDILRITGNTFAALNDNVSEKANVQQQLDYCNQLKKELNKADKEIKDDIAQVGNDTFMFRKEKYSYIVSLIKGIRYNISEPILLKLQEENSGWKRFVTEVLEFAGVRNLQNDYSNEWQYEKGVLNFKLRLDEQAKLVHIDAKSKQPVKSQPQTKHFSHMVDPDTILHFDENQELTLSLSRNVTEFDHYDVYEYFTCLSKWLRKEEINEYAGKNMLTVREASDLEDNIPLVIGEVRKTAPPPPDFVPDPEKLHGATQRWANYTDLERVGFFNEQGFLIGKVGYGSLIYTGSYDSHILTIASAGSGKGVGVVIPNLLRHRGSTVVLDPKGENFFVTAEHRFRKLQNQIFYFDPWDIVATHAKMKRKGIFPNAVKAGINPLDLLDARCSDIDMANQIANNLVLSENVSGDNTHFYTAAQSLIKQLIVFVCCSYPLGSKRRNLVEVRRLVTMPVSMLMKEIKDYDDWCQKHNMRMHNTIFELYKWLMTNSSKNMPSKFMQSVYNIAVNSTEFISIPEVQESLRETNMDITKIKQEQITLYLILDMDKLTFSSALYQPFFQLIVWFCMKGVGMSGVTPKDKVLLLLDEVAQLGHLNYLEKLLSLYRGKNVVVWTIWQSLSQIRTLYGDGADGILNNCDVQQFFGVNSNDDAKYVSERAGKTTIWMETISQTEGTSTITGDTYTSGNSYSNSNSTSNGTSNSNSYQGFNFTTTSGTSNSNTNSTSYTDSYGFSRSIQHGVTKTHGRTITKKEVDLVAPADVINGSVFNIVFLFFKKAGGCPYPILSGKIKYWEDLDFYGEFNDNITR
jgi:type IV secretory pathway TraG/TraD family ATPase VirD4